MAFFGSALYFWIQAYTCRPVYCSDMRYSAMLVVRFHVNCFPLFKKQTEFLLCQVRRKKN